MTARESASDTLADLILRRSCSPNSSIIEQSLNSAGGSKQSIDENQDQTNVELMFAELQASLLASEGAQEFFRKVTRFGLPSSDNLLFRENHVLSFDNRLRHPNWVLEHLSDSDVKSMNAVRHRQHMFSPNMTLHEYFRITNDDYKYSGYSRSHLSPVCNNRACLITIDQSFCLSNVAPQVLNLNEGYCPWSRLEKYVLFLATQSMNSYLITGTLYLANKSHPLARRGGERQVVSYKVISSKRTHFYKVVLTESYGGVFTIEAFLVPNSNKVSEGEKIERFRISVDRELPRLEKAAGLRLFDLLDRNIVAKPNKLRFEYPL